VRRLLITGGSSYLGQHLVEQVRRQPGGAASLCYTYYSHDPLTGPEGVRLDLRDGDAVQAVTDAFRPQVIIHTAGSNRPAETMDPVIRRGAEHITAAARRHNARLIHISTDVIFDGRRAPYREEDLPMPIHAYGEAKAAAEKIVAAYANHVIVRTSLIYGLEKMDRGTAWVVEAIQRGEPVTLFTDQMRNPILVTTLVAVLLELVDLAYTGILHVAGAQRVSRADYMLRLLRYWGVHPGSGVTLGRSDGERWPLDTTLDISRALALLQTPLAGFDALLPSATPIS
jgi:dTDP-4-dehydrorhamnose reductase